MEQKAHLSNLAGVKRDPFANLIQKEASRGVETSLLLFIIIVIRIRNNNHRCHVTCESQYSHSQQT